VAFSDRAALIEGRFVPSELHLDPKLGSRNRIRVSLNGWMEASLTAEGLNAIFVRHRRIGIHEHEAKTVAGVLRPRYKPVVHF